MSNEQRDYTDGPWGRAARVVAENLGFLMASAAGSSIPPYGSGRVTLAERHANLDAKDGPTPSYRYAALACEAAAQGGFTPTGVLTTLCNKQADYGHGNIDKYGHNGLHVRLWDKIARLDNLKAQGRGPACESVVDSYRDIVGYCIIGIMLLDGTFGLPLLPLSAARWTVEVREPRAGDRILVPEISGPMLVESDWNRPAVVVVEDEDE